MNISEKPKILVSVFPSGRSVATILKDGKTAWRTVSTGYRPEEILKLVSESETGLEVKERIWNEKMFQVPESAIGASIGVAKKSSLWPASWLRLF